MANKCICLAHGNNVKNMSQKGQQDFPPTNWDPAGILAIMDCHSDLFGVYVFWIADFQLPRFPDCQIPRFLDFKIPRFPYSQIPDAGGAGGRALTS